MVMSRLRSDSRQQSRNLSVRLALCIARNNTGILAPWFSSTLQSPGFLQVSVSVSCQAPQEPNDCLPNEPESVSAEPESRDQVYC